MSPIALLKSKRIIIYDQLKALSAINQTRNMKIVQFCIQWIERVLNAFVAIFGSTVDNETMKQNNYNYTQIAVASSHFIHSSQQFHVKW